MGVQKAEQEARVQSRKFIRSVCAQVNAESAPCWGSGMGAECGCIAASELKQPLLEVVWRLMGLQNKTLQVPSSQLQKQ